MNEFYLSELSLKDVEGAGPQVANIRRLPMNNWYWNSRRSLGVLPFDARTPLPRAAPLTVIGAGCSALFLPLPTPRDGCNPLELFYLVDQRRIDMVTCVIGNPMSAEWCGGRKSRSGGIHYLPSA